MRSFERHKDLTPTLIIVLTTHASMYPFMYSHLTPLLTRNPVIRDRERCLRAGIDDHITSMFTFSSYFFMYLMQWSHRTTPPHILQVSGLLRFVIFLGPVIPFGLYIGTF